MCACVCVGVWVCVVYVYGGVCCDVVCGYDVCVVCVRSVSMCARRIWCMLFFSGKSVRHVCGVYVCGVCVVYVFHVWVSCMCQMCIL